MIVKKTNLVPLKIASGWFISTNNFVETDISENGDPQRQWYELHEDLFFMYKMAYNQIEQKYTYENWPCLDVSWKGDGDPRNGFYQLCILNTDWENVAFTLTTRNRAIIQDVIELASQGLGYTEEVPAIVNQIVKHLEGNFDLTEWSWIPN